MQEILNRIVETYGSLSEPNYKFAQQFDLKSYGRYIRAISRRFWVNEITDENADVCTSLQFKDSEDRHYILQVSNVGNYAILMNLNNKQIYTDISPKVPKSVSDAIRELRQDGLIFLDKEILSKPIAMQLNYAENPRIYNALFSDLDRLPWEC